MQRIEEIVGFGRDHERLVDRAEADQPSRRLRPEGEADWDAPDLRSPRTRVGGSTCLASASLGLALGDRIHRSTAAIGTS